MLMIDGHLEDMQIKGIRQLVIMDIRLLKTIPQSGVGKNGIIQMGHGGKAEETELYLSRYGSISSMIPVNGINECVLERYWG